MPLTSLIWRNLSLSISIDNVSKVSGIAIAITAIVAVGTFICSVIDHREERRNDRISSWRKVAIHEAFQRSQSNELKISEIQSKLKTEAWDASVDIRKKELSSIEIRELLLEMIASGIVEQNKGDIYNLRFAPDRAILEAQVKNLSRIQESIAPAVENIEKIQKFETELNKKLNTRRTYNMEEIFKEIAEPLGINNITYNLIMRYLHDQGAIKIDEDKSVTLIPSETGKIPKTP